MELRNTNIVKSPYSSSRVRLEGEVLYDDAAGSELYWFEVDEKYAKDLKIAATSKYKNKPYAQSLKFSWNKIALKYMDLISNILKK